MKRDGKLFTALHILAHLAAPPLRPLTSEELAGCLHTHPVVIRRSLAGLREAGIVISAKGHGGGWTLAHPAMAISLGDVYVALGERGVLVPLQEPGIRSCLVEATVADALDGFYAEAETLLLRRLGAISLADLSAGVKRRWMEQAGLSGLMDVAPGQMRDGGNRPTAAIQE